MATRESVLVEAVRGSLLRTGDQSQGSWVMFDDGMRHHSAKNRRGWGAFSSTGTHKVQEDRPVVVAPRRVTGGCVVYRWCQSLEAIALCASTNSGVAPRGVPVVVHPRHGSHKPIAELQCGCSASKVSNPDRSWASWALQTGTCNPNGVWWSGYSIGAPI